METPECKCALCGKTDDEVTGMVTTPLYVVCVPCVEAILAKVEVNHSSDSQNDIDARQMAADVRATLKLARWRLECSGSPHLM